LMHCHFLKNAHFVKNDKILIEEGHFNNRIA